MFLKKVKEKICPVGSECLSNCNIKKCLCFTFRVALISVLTFVAIYGLLRKQIIEQMLLSNPRAIIKAVEKIRDVETKKTQEESKKKVPEIYNKITSKASMPFIGNKDGNVKIVLFHDINCGYCKKQIKEYMELTKARNDIKIYLADFPVLSRDSFVAAQVIIYVYLHHRASFEKFFTFLASAKQVNEATIKEGLKLAKVPLSALQDAQKNPQIMEELKSNHKDGGELGLQGTPASMLMNKNGEKVLIPGYASIDVVLANISK